MNATCKPTAITSDHIPFQLSIPTPSASALLTSSKATCKVHYAVQRFLDTIPVSPCCISKVLNTSTDAVAPLQNSRRVNTDRSKRIEGGNKPDIHVWACAEAEAAAQREIDEDDYSWYYRNPQRYNRRPRNARVRMQRRKKIMCGVATGEDGSPTNRTLFAAYLARHYPSIRMTSCIAKEEGKDEQCEVMDENATTETPDDSWKMESGCGMQIFDDLQAKVPHGPRSNVEACVVDPTMDEWQEDLFTPNEAYANRYNSRPRSFSISSSIQSYSSTDSYYDSPASSARLSCGSPPIKVEIEDGRFSSNKLPTSPLAGRNSTAAVGRRPLPFLRLYSS